MKNTTLAVLLAVLALVAVGARASTSEDLEHSAVINGTIVVAKDGTVQLATVDDEAKVGKPIANLVRQTALSWHFEPVLREGEPVVAKASMHARVVLKKMADGNFSARIKGATFGSDNPDSTDEPYSDDSKKIQPRYPASAIKNRVQGTVYLALHIGHDGHVTDAMAEQVNLQNVGPERILKQYRRVLAEASLEPARQWTYRIPTTGKLATQDSWTVHVPVVFTLTEMGVARPKSVWTTYAPGPFTPAPWVDKPDMASADALADDGTRTEGAGPVLRSSFNQG